MKGRCVFQKVLVFFYLSTIPLLGFSQKNIPIIHHLNEIDRTLEGTHHYWLEMGFNTYGQPMLIPVIAIQGSTDGPTLGLTAAIHGNELNGIPIIHHLMDSIDTKNLKGRILAIPGLNAYSIQTDQRRFIDKEDINRNFPGKKTGNRSQQYAYKIGERILPTFDIHIDMHTASFGRTNSLYVRADLANDTLKTLAQLQQADIILNSIGKPSTSTSSGSSRTMRAEAMSRGIPCITVEYGNPQVFQKEMIQRGTQGIMNTLAWLKMYDEIEVETLEDNAVYCRRSFWMYMEEGGFLSLHVNLKEKLKKGQKIATVKDAFGEVLKEYFAPVDGIVIGKSTNPTNMSGGRLIHLGVLLE